MKKKSLFATNWQIHSKSTTESTVKFWKNTHNSRSVPVFGEFSRTNWFPNGQGILVIFHDTAVDERSLEFKSLFSMAEIRDSPVELGSLSHELQGYSKVSWILEPSTVGIQADGPPRREGSSSHTTRALYIHYESGCLHQKAGMAYIFPWITYIYLIWI